MSSHPPLFSIIIPLQNKGPFILETLDSLLKQTCQDWECHVVENGSTDDSAEKVRSIQDPRIHLHISQAQGPCSARNEGIQHSQGKWILFLDADDLLPPDYLNAKKAAMNEQRGSDLYVCPWEEQQRDGKVIRRDPFGARVSRDEMLASSLVYPSFAIHSAIVHRKILTPENQWPEFLDQDLAEDAVFWFRLLHQASIAFHDNSHAIYRNQTVGCRNELQNLPKVYESFEKTIKANLRYLDEKKIKTTSRHAYYLHSFYASMKKQALEQKRESLAGNAQTNLDRIYPKLSPWDQFKTKIKNIFSPQRHGATE